ncbi:MAG: hypothetical protein ACKN82_06815 [Pirellula sp.]
MAKLSWLQRLYWNHFSKPVSERALFLHVLEKPLTSVLEIGMGSGQRIARLLALNASVSELKPIRYTAIDPFESNSDALASGQGVLSLKAAHRILSERGVKAHLVPGEPAGSVARVAHSVLPSDLIIIDGYWENEDVHGQAIAQWLPRLCHVQSTVFVSKKPGEAFVKVPVPSNAMPTMQTKAA